MAKYPFSIEPISDEQKAERKEMYVGAQTLMVDMVRTVPRGILMPARFQTLAEDIYNMEVREDDVWMITYPKAGSTWTQVSSHCSRAGKKSTMIVKTIALVYEGRASFVCTP